MSNHTNTIDFLTSPENLTPTLEILQHGDAIHAKALSLFWIALANRLHSTLPASLAAETMVWDEADKVPAKAAGPYAGIALHLDGSQTQAQELNFRIEQANGAKNFELYFGLHWKKEVPQASVMAANQPDVLALRTFQEENGFSFDNNSWWWGWKYLRKDSRRNEFLLECNHSSEMVAEIATTFWSWVELASKLVIKANQSFSDR